MKFKMPKNSIFGNILHSIQITDALNFATRYITELEMNIVAVERVKEYAEIATEVCNYISI